MRGPAAPSAKGSKPAGLDANPACAGRGRGESTNVASGSFTGFWLAQLTYTEQGADI